MKSSDTPGVEWAYDAHSAAIRNEPEPDYCEYAGHEWAPMGGGMFVCMVCEIEEDNPLLDDDLAFVGTNMDCYGSLE